MNVIDIQQTVKLSLPITDQKYTGNKDNCNFRHYNGKQEWSKQEFHQQYTGEFLHDCLHGYGNYSWKNIDTRYRSVCEGKFYANNIEGYATMSYQDGKVFEGLFKENRRFGPGVLTYSNGSQDVGLWEGKSLVRLNQRPNNTVPFIAESVQGKVYLLKFKNLVPVQEKNKSIAYQMLSNLSTNEEILEKSDLLHSKFVKNTKSVFFNKTFFNDKFFQNEEDWTIDVIEFPQGDTPTKKKILVTHLLAWNNEKLCAEFMKHAFKHRNQEHVLTYNVANVSTGRRSLFKVSGFQESIALQFLHYCSENKPLIISKLITHNDLYVDICDCYGNNGILYAATYDQTSVLQILTNYGANVDHMNDECLTALIVTILRYTALKYSITNWENAFLPAVSCEDISPETQEWRNNYFITSTKTSFNSKQEYFYDLNCIYPTSAKVVPRRNTYKDIKKKGKKESIDADNIRKTNMLQLILETIICLLKCGAKPNYGLCPFPPLILSVFSRSSDILCTLLTYGANPNIRISSHLGSLTPLHIVASLTPCAELIAMAGYLLSGGADYTLRANTTHWVEESKILIGKYPVEIDEGKTALHLLCMRYDFRNDTNDYLGELCSLMLMLGVDPNLEYIGHNALTLAILRGNVKMISHVLDSGIVDPNQALSNKMGVPLTVLVLKRYESILPATTCKNVFNRLLEYYANPLNTVLGFNCNAMEFAYDENAVKEEKCEKFSKSHKSRKSAKSVKPIRLKGNDLIIEVLRYAAEDTAIKRIQKRVVEYLYQFKIECDFQDPTWDVIVKYIDVQRCVTMLQLLVDYNLIYPCRTFMVELLEYVAANITDKKRKMSTSSNFFNYMVDNIDFDKTEFREKVFSFNIFMPELDPDESKFKVCFECFQKRNKVLMLCPKCHLVYFCSQDCNMKNNKRKDTKHPCNILFYNSEFHNMQKRLGNENFNNEPIDIFGEYGKLRQILIDSNPDYFNRMRDLDVQRENIRKTLTKVNKLFTRRSTISSRTEQSAKFTKSEASDKDQKSSKIIKKSKSPTKTKESRKDKLPLSPGNKERKKEKKQVGLEKKRTEKERKGTEIEKKGTEKEKKGTENEKKGGVKEKKEETQFDGLPDELRQSAFDVCEKFDYKFYQMFMPFCICVDSQLYYKFDNISKYYKLASFSHI